MTEFTDQEIADEAYRIWQADGSPIWSHATDHWLRAIENLRRRGEEDTALGKSVDFADPPSPEGS